MFERLGSKLVGIRIPSAMTGANITFLIGDNAGVFLPYHNAAGSELTIPITVDTHIGMVLEDFEPVQRVKIVSDASEAADRTLILFLTQ